MLSTEQKLRNRRRLHPRLRGQDLFLPTFRAGGQSFDLHQIDDPNYRRVNGRFDVSYRSHRGKAFLNGKNPISDSCINCIKRDKSVAHGSVMKVEGLYQQDLFALMSGLLLRGDDVADYSCYNHCFLATKRHKGEL